MRRLVSCLLATAVVTALGAGLAPPSTAAASAASVAADRDQRLDAYTARQVTSDQLGSLAQQGYDLTEAHPTGKTSQVDLVLTAEGGRGPPGPGHRPEPDQGQGRADGPPVRRGPGGERLQRLAFVRRARRHPRPGSSRRPAATGASRSW